MARKRRAVAGKERPLDGLPGLCGNQLDTADEDALQLARRRHDRQREDLVHRSSRGDDSRNAPRRGGGRPYKGRRDR